MDAREAVKDFVKKVEELTEKIDGDGMVPEVVTTDMMSFELSLGTVMEYYVGVLQSMIRVMNSWRSLPRGSQKIVVEEMNKVEAANDNEE